jgi:hypothetical protein
MSYGQDEQVAAEMLDADKIDPTDYPPDEPLGLPELEGRDVTVAGDYAPDSVAERSGREEPDFGARSTPGDEDALAPTIVEPDDAFGADETAEALGEEAEDDQPVLDTIYLSEGEDAPEGEDDERSAEEAAMHVTDLGAAPRPDVDDLI